MKKIVLLAIALMLSVPVFADETKIAVVDVQRIMASADAAKGLQKLVEDEKKKFEGQVKAQEEKLQKKDKELSEQRSVLSKEAFEKKRNEFAKEVNEAQKKIQERKQKLEGAFNKSLGLIQEATVKIVGEIAKDKKYMLVIPTNQIMYADKSTDITDIVLEKLNKSLPKLTVELPAQ